MPSIRTAFALLALASGVSPALADRVRVTGDRVCLRAMAQPDAEVVAQVSTGDELEVLSGLDSAWVQVVPPPSADLWIFAELVQGDQVVVSKAQVRAGAGLNFNVVGTLRRGTPVKDRGRVGDWMKIAPPEGTSLWVSREFVEILASSAPPVPPPPPTPVAPEIPSVQPIPAPTPLVPAVPATVPPAAAPETPSDAMPAPDPRYPVVPPEEAPPPEPEAVLAPTLPVPVAPTAVPSASPPPAIPTPPPLAITPDPAPSTEGWEQPNPSVPGQPSRPRVLFPQQAPAEEATVGPARIPADRLSPRFVQGKPGRYEGQLSGAGAIFYTPGKFRLVTLNQAGRAETVCYVLGSERQLNALLGSRLAINGPVYWFRSTQYPTVLAEQIQRMP